MKTTRIAVSVVALGLLLATACSKASDQTTGGTGNGPAVNVQLKEFSIGTDVTSVPAGSVTFNVANDGAAEHEFVVIRTDTAPDALAVTGKEADETGAVDEIEGIQPASDGALTVDLPAGLYVLICNLPGHYGRGMNAGIAVS